MGHVEIAKIYFSLWISYVLKVSDTLQRVWKKYNSQWQLGCRGLLCITLRKNPCIALQSCWFQAAQGNLYPQVSWYKWKCRAFRWVLCFITKDVFSSTPFFCIVFIHRYQICHPEILSLRMIIIILYFLQADYAKFKAWVCNAHKGDIIDLEILVIQ